MQLISIKNISAGLVKNLKTHPLGQFSRFQLCMAILVSCSLFILGNAQQDSATIYPDSSDQNITYVVKEGDTFWDLAFEYTGDPFEWPFIWKDNPHIKNPDLIYPGDLVLISSSTDQDSALMNNDSVAQQNQKNKKNLHSPDISGQSLIKGKFLLSSHLFSSVPFLWSKKDSSGNIYPGNATVEKPAGKETYQLFDIVTLRPAKGVVYISGDTLDLFTSIRFVRFKNSVANLIQKVGRAVVIKTEDKKITARLFEMSEVVKGGERASRSAAVALKGIYKFEKPDSAIKAEVYERTESTPSPYLFQTLILNQGESKGIRIGDVFAVYHYDKEKVARYSMTGYAAHVTKESTSLIIVSISNNEVSAGDSAIIILRSKPADN